MKTSINGKDCPWPAEIWALWDKVETEAMERVKWSPKAHIAVANYFTPRAPDRTSVVPNDGSGQDGFTYSMYTERDWVIPQVWQAIIRDRKVNPVRAKR